MPDAVESISFFPAKGEIVIAAKNDPPNINGLYDDFGRAQLPPGQSYTAYISKN